MLRPDGKCFGQILCRGADLCGCPQPRLADGRILAPHVHAMMDVSDGLLIDAARMARASGLAVTIDLSCIPLSDAYRAFDPRMEELARPFFTEGWIDAPVAEGKAPGAFAHPTVTDAHQFVMLNYLGKPRDVMTLAHELGHGVHQVLAAGQGELLSSTPLTLAETASVFGEMLTFRKLLAEAPDARTRKALLAQKVEEPVRTQSQARSLSR